jgi:hypothetical protein
MISKKQLLFCAFSALYIQASAQTARLQVIHNSADAAAASVDVYVNGSKLLDNFAFRTATRFIDAPAGTPITIAVAPASSTSVADAIYSTTTTLADKGVYVAVANGIVSTSGYSPAKAFGLNVYGMGRESAAAGNTDLLVAHGCTDAGEVDVRGIGNPTPLVNDIDFGEFAGYLTMPASSDIIINVTTPDGSAIAASYTAPLSTLGLGGKALTVVASGFLDPSKNSGGPGFGLWVATDTGGAMIPLPLNSKAHVQVIHNCADAAAATVDIYAGAAKLDDVKFRTATGFIPFETTSPLTVAVAPASSSSAADAIFTKNLSLQAGASYIVVADGIVSTTGYSPAPAFDLQVYDKARESGSAMANTDVLIHHGSTDAPTVDVLSGTTKLSDDLAYTSFAGYLELPNDDYPLAITTADGATVVKRYSAPLKTLSLGGKALTVLASGFLDPAKNSGGAAFGLWAALSSGGPLVELPEAPLSIRSVSMDTDLILYPNPAGDEIRVNGLSKGSHNFTVVDLSGRAVLQGILNNGAAINVSNLQAGQYFIQLQQEDLITTVMMSKQ